MQQNSLLLRYFNSHPHKEDDDAGVEIDTEQTNFNSHPHKEDDTVNPEVKMEKQNFNSHPHKEDDSQCKCYQAESVISTHILTRRMTRTLVYDSGLKIISTHILTRRMTTSVSPYSYRQHFNSHPHKEDDQWPVARGCAVLSFQLTSSQGG